MSVRVRVNRDLFEWAIQRCGQDRAELDHRFPQLSEWLSGARQPTHRQLEAFATATHSPLGYFFLPEPPVEKLPIPDYRTMVNAGVGVPSADLLDTIYQCQDRQSWYREYALASGERPVNFIGTLTTESPVHHGADEMRQLLGFNLDERGSTFTEAIGVLSARAEDLGVLVMVNGVVGSNTHRKLNPEEFRGFALVDDLAPLIFVNGADTKAAQIFTLAHELAHLWIGQSALSDVSVSSEPSDDAEQWCNQVAAEFLLPLDLVRSTYDRSSDLTSELDRLAKAFKVSTLVVLRRLRDAGFVGGSEYWGAYSAELERVLALVGAGGAGGNFYNTQPVRMSKRFTRALITSTLEGRTPETEAFRMLGFKKAETFAGLAASMGVR